MRIITRGDFDGLCSSVLLTEVHAIEDVKFAHPKDVQDGLIVADENDIVVNVPYIPGCGLWFDHHVSEEKKIPKMGSFEGRFEIAPSCARVIHNYYKDQVQGGFADLEEMMIAVDKLDSANLTEDEVKRPSGWILLGLTIDPRSGLGPEFQKYFRWLVEFTREVPIKIVLSNFEVKKRTDSIKKDQEEYKKILAENACVDGAVIITDFRETRIPPVGNRFIVFTMFPEANVEVRLLRGKAGNSVVAVGHSIFNRTCDVNVGEMLSEYGGGGHRGAGTAQLPLEIADVSIKAIVDRLKKNEG